MPRRSRRPTSTLQPTSTEYHAGRHQTPRAHQKSSMFPLCRNARYASHMYTSSGVVLQNAGQTVVETNTHATGTLIRDGCTATRA